MSTYSQIFNKQQDKEELGIPYTGTNIFCHEQQLILAIDMHTLSSPPIEYPSEKRFSAKSIGKCCLEVTLKESQCKEIQCIQVKFQMLSGSHAERVFS
jgi:hypothetical protein